MISLPETQTGEQLQKTASNDRQVRTSEALQEKINGSRSICKSLKLAPAVLPKIQQRTL
jgi:hypothetical protein